MKDPQEDLKKGLFKVVNVSRKAMKSRSKQQRKVVGSEKLKE